MSRLSARSAGMSSKQPTAVSESESEASDHGSPRETHEQEFDIDFEKFSPEGKGKGRVASASSVEDQYALRTPGGPIESLAGSPIEGYVNTGRYTNDNKAASRSTDVTNTTEGLALDRLNEGGIKNLDVKGLRALMTSSLFEFYCNSKAADILNAQSGGQDRYTRDSAEAKELGKKIFVQNSELMAAHGLLQADLERDDFGPFRKEYLRVLDKLGSTALKGVDLNVVETSGDALVKEGGSARGTVLKDSASGNGLSRTAPMRIPSGRHLAGRNNQENVIPMPGTFKPGSPHLQAYPSFNQPSYIQQDGLSRWSVEFAEEKELIGKGGFGTVWRVRHLMDGQLYAVKMIPISEKQLLKLNKRKIDEIVGEIQTLAQLEHPNIVRYYGAWTQFNNITAVPRSQSGKARALVEDGVKSSDSNMDVVSKGQEQTSGNGKYYNGPPSRETENGIGDYHETSPREPEQDISINIAFEYSSDHDDDKNDNEASSREPGHQADVDENSSSQTGAQNDEVEMIPRTLDKDTGYLESNDDPFTDGNRSLHAGNARTAPLTLFIQMSLHPVCLAQYVKSSSLTGPRHCFHLLPALKIMLGVIDGVEYIHSKGIIHRDLKPGNILLSRPESDSEAKCPACASDGLQTWSYTVPRIADFGLVANYSHRQGAIEAGPSTAVVRPVGTEFYRPHAATIIDESLDVFALGVVLFELVYQFDTMTERAVVLSGLTCSPSFLTTSPTKPELPKGFGPAMTNCVLKTCGPDTPDDEVQAIVDNTTALILGMVEPEAGERWHLKEIREALKDLVARVVAARA